MTRCTKCKILKDDAAFPSLEPNSTVREVNNGFFKCNCIVCNGIDSWRVGANPAL